MAALMLTKDKIFESFLFYTCSAMLPTKNSAIPVKSSDFVVCYIALKPFSQVILYRAVRSGPTLFDQ